MSSVASTSSGPIVPAVNGAEAVSNGTSTNGSANHRQEAGEEMTEEEAALYDRQLRLWGSVAQSRIRQCRVLITPFQGGVAIETAKNLILAGVKEVILLDDGEVDGYSLTSGFVWREEDIGQKRVEAAHARLSSLNPHVTITTIVQPPTLASISPLLEPSDKTLSAVVYTNSNPFSASSLDVESLQQLNEICRSAKVKFHASSSQGLDGWIFQDLGENHQFLVERRSTYRDEKNAAVEKVWTELQEQSFVPLSQTLKHEWTAKKGNALKRLLKGSENLWGTWAIWSLQKREGISGPESVLPSMLLEAVEELLTSAKLDGKALWAAEGLDAQEWAETFLTNALPLHPTQPADFAPTTAVLGGILSQEILNAVGGREAPKVANWLLFYGLKGQAPVFSLGGLGVAKSKLEGSAEEVKAS